MHIYVIPGTMIFVPILRKRSENNMPDDKLLHHIFELSYALDTQSAGKDYISLRRTHYDNQTWIHDNGYQEEYYQFFINKLKEEQ